MQTRSVLASLFEVRDHEGYGWRLELPRHARQPMHGDTNRWLAELWEMRGRVIFENGQCPQFRREDGSYSDQDSMDDICYHATVRNAGCLVGCVRLVRLEDAAETWVRHCVGRNEVRQVLAEVGSSEAETGEVGRWVVDPRDRGRHLGWFLMSGVHATAQALGLKTIVGLCGTRKHQDRAFFAMGWKPVPGFDTIPAPKFDDDVRFISFDVQAMRTREMEMCRRMARLLSLPASLMTNGTSERMVVVQTGNAIGPGYQCAESAAQRKVGHTCWISPHHNGRHESPHVLSPNSTLPHLRRSGMRRRKCRSRSFTNSDKLASWG